MIKQVPNGASRNESMQGISVVLPNFNHAIELETSLGAITRQSRPFDEIIVIDDASTDHSIEVIRGFADSFPQLRLLRNERRMGVAAAVNRGIAAATRPHVVLASADERVEPLMCETFHRALQDFPDLRLAVSCYSEWDESTGVLTHFGRQPGLGMWYAMQDEPFLVSADRFLDLLGRQFAWLAVNTALFRTDALRQVGGFDESLRWHSDWFAIYAIALRHGFCAIPRTLAAFRRSTHSYSARGMRDKTLQRDVVVAIADKLARPDFADIRRAVRKAPAALSPFVRAMVPAFATRPRHYDLLVALVRWWLGEFLRLRRPGALLRLRGRIARLFGQDEPAPPTVSAETIRRSGESPARGERP